MAASILRSIFGEGLIRKTVQPAFAGLGRSNDRVSGSVRMFAGVPVWRTIAAERHAALLAGAQMNPLRANFHTFLAFAALWLLD
jgi:hypothetical protein